MAWGTKELFGTGWEDMFKISSIRDQWGDPEAANKKKETAILLIVFAVGNEREMTGRIGKTSSIYVLSLIHI